MNVDDKSQNLQDKFRVAMLSMVKYAQFLEGEVLALHFVSDPVSKVLREKMLQEFFKNVTFKYEVGIQIFALLPMWFCDIK